MTTIATPIPTRVEAIDTAWFQAILAEDVLDATRLEVIHGTATMVKVELTLAGEDGGGPRRRTVWVKTGLEPHSKSIGAERVYAGETFFYRSYGGKFETRTPDCLYAESDDDGNSVIVLDDLLKIGATFIDPTVPGSPDLIAAGLTSIARYQAASWMNPDLWAVDWLRQGGAFDAADCLGWIYDPAHWIEYSQRPRYRFLPPQLRDRDRLLAAHSALRQDWLRREPWALSHGDAHYGQLYSLPNGEARLLDWQCVQVANFMQDPANLIVSGLSVADRRAYDRDLLAHYVGKLAEFGVPSPPSADEAFSLLGAYAMHQVSWVMCLTEMQPEAVCEAITERACAAAVDYGTVARLLGG
jgi:Phosphotransferase enzyme family